METLTKIGITENAFHFIDLNNTALTIISTIETLRQIVTENAFPFHKLKGILRR